LQVDAGPVVEEAPPLRIETHEIEIIREVSPRLREDALQNARHGEDRGTHVEAKAVLVQHRGLAADPGIFVVERHRMTAGRRDAGRRQPAESTADHGDRSCLSVQRSVLPPGIRMRFARAQLL
jgi:hypothetical protein